MKKFGLGYNKLKKVSPKLIYCSISGYGEIDPWKARPAYDIILQGEVSFMSITGEEGGLAVRIGVALVDIITALYAVQGILAALTVRERGAKGIGWTLEQGKEWFEQIDARLWPSAACSTIMRCYHEIDLDEAGDINGKGCN